jgi:hypothetical protein
LMHGPLAYRSWHWISALLAAALILSTAFPTCAGIIVSVESVSANQGTTGNALEVDVQNTGASVDIASFSFEISVAAGSGVTFTGADINTVANVYIFAGNSAQGPNIDTLTGTTLDASDNAASGSTTLGTNSTLALGRVFFDVATSAPVGPVTVSFTPFPSTSLTDPNLNDIPIDTLNSGTITISGTIVPEPSALVSATTGLLASAWFVLRKRRSAAREFS